VAGRLGPARRNVSFGLIAIPIVLAGFLGAGLAAQSKSAADRGSPAVLPKSIDFEVSSIEQDLNDHRSFVPAIPRNGDGITLEYVSIEFAIRFAYELDPGTRISGLPPPNDVSGFVESYRQGIVKAHHLRMARFRQYLAGLGLGRGIEDQTGLEVNYDFTLGDAPLPASGVAALEEEPNALLFTQLQ
jgi:hypothetical protein